MHNIYRMKTSPRARQENMVLGDRYRITVLTECLMRLEYSADGRFEDRATQVVLNRDFPETEFRVICTDDGIEVHTSRLYLKYDEKQFSPGGLSIQLKGNLTAYHSIWRYGENFTDLGGTARTLDGTDGTVPLGQGVISRNGFSLLDDSCSQVLKEDGWIEPRRKGIQDIYFWGYGHDYRKALDDFSQLCGKTPMLPRFALGNWWSRFYRYSEESYLELMDRFARENFPFTVAVIDMDWHLVDIDPKYGSGWTGYTWNRELFPDPSRFLEKLHDRGMKVTLNVHPADGVRAHEDMYTDMAKALGVDYEKEDPVVCDPADQKFLEAYFKYLHHPREEEGVDFWWIDWQQGSLSKVEGLDPLWIFNHFHFLDSRRNGKRPLTFSRYAGPGSHRYPIGFSGDTIATWKSLDFQPYFTLTASNIGYGWWSHDIGGHMMGYKNDEMVARWVQFGVYSPIMRLHSSNSEFNGKEPWRYKRETEEVMGHMLRERHRMLPYLYTMNYRNYKENMPLISPMYYDWPEEDEAYKVKNQYFFGTSLMIAPITTPRIRKLNVAKVRVWLPQGLWYDIHTGMVYSGGRTIDMYRNLESVPVLAPAGSIIPFTDEISAKQTETNPTSFHIFVYAGMSGEFTLYEDDNTSCGYEQKICCMTKMVYHEDRKSVFTIYPTEGTLSLVPEMRSYRVEMTGLINQPDTVIVKVDGQRIETENSYNDQKRAVVVDIQKTEINKKIEIFIDTALIKAENDVIERCFAFLNQAEIEFTLKDKLFTLIRSKKSVTTILSELLTMDIDKELMGILAEILSAYVN